MLFWDPFSFFPHITLCQFKCSQRKIGISVSRNVNLVVCLCSGTSLPFHMDTLKARGVLSQPSASHIWKGEESHDRPEQASAADMARINSDAAWNDEISWAAWIAAEFDFSWPVWMNTMRDYPSTKKTPQNIKKKRKIPDSFHMNVLSCTYQYYMTCWLLKVIMLCCRHQR